MQALILVDIQNDFLPGGALGVPHGDEIISVANRLMERVDLTAASQDWHPTEHGGFAVNHPGKKVGDEILLHGLKQRLWPVHCVENTYGSAFAANLDQSKIDRVFRKGTHPMVDSYSAFYDNAHLVPTGLTEFLKEKKIDDLLIMGLATDHCLKATVLDALKDGFKVGVVKEGCRAINLSPRDEEKAWKEMTDAGAEIVSFKMKNLHGHVLEDFVNN